MTTAITENPFPGLRPFEPHESFLYFGRDDQIDELLARLEQTRFLAVVGTSGGGKSSLIRAGLLPALQRGYMTGAGSRWRVALFRPGDDPIGGLAKALDQPRETLDRSSLGLVEATRELRLDGRENLLVVVDQFEELFRFHKLAVARDGGDEAAAFVKLLLRASEQSDVPSYVVLTMRSDYLGDCAQFRGLPEALNSGQYLVPRMTRDQQCEAIEDPVAVGGAEITPRLVQRLLNDVGDDPDQLPILQHTLMRTWELSGVARSQGQPIDLEHYEATGTTAEALNRHADEAFEELRDEPGSQEIARKLFQRLTEKGADKRETCQPTSLRELCAVIEADEAHVIAVINRFRTKGRTFLTSPDGDDLNSDSVIDISHESLIRLWQRLKSWVDEEAESAEQYQRLARAAELYPQKESLWRDPALQLALDWKEHQRPNAAWAERYHPGFERAMHFLEESRKARKTAQRRNLVIFATLCLLTLGSVVSAFLAYINWRLAEEQRTLAGAQKLAAQADLVFTESDSYLERSALLAIESMTHLHLFENDSALRQVLSLLPKLIAHLPHEAAVRAVAFSLAGRYLATGSEDKTARVFEAATGKELARLPHEDTVGAVAFSPAGRYLATGSEDKTARVFEAATGKELARLPHEDTVWAVAFSPNGRYLATGSWDKTAGVFEAETGRELTRFPHKDGVGAVAFSPNGCYLATGSWDKTARVFEVVTGKELARLPHEDTVWAVTFSPDGRTVATGSEDKTASPDGRTVATRSEDKTARVFEAATGKELARLRHGGEVMEVAFSPDGRYLNTVSVSSVSKDLILRRYLFRPKDLIAEACSRLTRNLTQEEWKQYLGNIPYRKTCLEIP